MSVRVDFYLLNSPTLSASHEFICKLIEKVYKQGHRLYIHAADLAQAKLLNDTLWTFHDISFIPHKLYSDSDAESVQKPPILIGYGQQIKNAGEILLNLTTAVPPFFAQFARIIEIVPKHDECQQKGREHYKFYRAQGCELFTHDLKKA